MAYIKDFYICFFDKLEPAILRKILRDKQKNIVSVHSFVLTLTGGNKLTKGLFMVAVCDKCYNEIIAPNYTIVHTKSAKKATKNHNPKYKDLLSGKRRYDWTWDSPFEKD